MLIIWMLIETSAGIFASVYAIPVKPDIVFDLSLSLILLFVLPLVTSVFPFLRYNYSSPITSLRSVNAGGNSIVSRAVFLFIQYVITFSLIVVALFFVRQLYTMLNADLGYQAKNIISCQFLSFETQNRRYANDEEWQKERDLERHKVQVIKQKMDAYFEKGNIDVFLLEFAELLSGMFRQRIVQNVDFVLFIMGRMSNQRLQRNAQVRHVIFIRGEKNGDNRCLSHLFILIVV